MPQDFTDGFATIDLEDPPWSRRLSNVVAALLKSPGMSISAACGGWNETVVIYRLLNREDVSADALISPHHEATIQRFAMFPCIVVFQDPTDFDFSRMKEAKDSDHSIMQPDGDSTCTRIRPLCGLSDPSM